MEKIYFARIQSKDKRKVTMQADAFGNARGRADGGNEDTTSLDKNITAVVSADYAIRYAQEFVHTLMIQSKEKPVNRYDIVSESQQSPRPQIKSRERVRSIAEVYTRDEEIDAMLDLLGDVSSNIQARFLEPAAGNGNFLIRILERKLKNTVGKAKARGKRSQLVQKDFEFNALVSLASLYAVDIDAHNIEEARDRLRVHLKDIYSGVFNTFKPTEGFDASVNYILQHNIVQGDMLHGTHLIRFTEFSTPKPYKFTQRVYSLQDLMTGGMFSKQKPRPLLEIPMRNYWELADV